MLYYNCKKRKEKNKMLVYVVIEDRCNFGDIEGREIIGIYSTYDKAVKVADFWNSVEKSDFDYYVQRWQVED